MQVYKKNIAKHFLTQNKKKDTQLLVHLFDINLIKSYLDKHLCRPLKINTQQNKKKTV